MAARMEALSNTGIIRQWPTRSESRPPSPSPQAPRHESATSTIASVLTSSAATRAAASTRRAPTWSGAPAVTWTKPRPTARSKRSWATPRSGSPSLGKACTSRPQAVPCAGSSSPPPARTASCVPNPPEGVTITNVSGLHATPIGEWVLSFFLMHAKQMPHALDLQRRASWERYGVTNVRGSTVAVIGLGAIGSEVARLSQAFGARVIATRRSAQPGASAPNVDALTR